jgi:hypothetical protein
MQDQHDIEVRTRLEIRRIRNERRRIDRLATILRAICDLVDVDIE